MPARDGGALPGRNEASRSQAGAYFPATGHIELAPELDLDTVYGRSFLVHELVHAYQYATGVQRSVACYDQLEYDAYQVQAAYLRANGEADRGARLAVLGVLLSACPGETIGWDY